MIKAALDYYYAQGSKRDLVKEAGQCGVMVIRFLENLDKYERMNGGKDDAQG